jgi:flagellar protein FliO/FliZ
MPTDPTSILTASVALPAVLGLIWLAGRLARATGLGTLRRAGRRGAAAGRALAVEEVLALDPRRKLLLVRCEAGRVVLLTGGTDLVVGWLPPAKPDAL